MLSDIHFISVLAIIITSKSLSMVICNTEKVVVNFTSHMYMLTMYLFTFLQDFATPLFMASQNGHKNVVDVLLRHGADPNLADIVSIKQ